MVVHNWHKMGGTVLETSRGGFDFDRIGDAFQDCSYNQIAPCGALDEIFGSFAL